MSFRMLGLHNMVVNEAAMEEDDFSLSFSQADVIKTMDNARQRTLWRQSGRLLIRQAELMQTPEQEAPYTLSGGDLSDNIYVYRDSIRLPLHSRGQVGIEFAVRENEKKLIVRGNEIEIMMRGVARYLKHLDEER